MATLASRINDLASAVRGKFNQIMPRLIPTGGTSGQVLTKASNADYSLTWSSPSSGDGMSMSSGMTTNAVLHVRDERASGTASGSSVAGAQTRVLNTVKTNTITNASLASNMVSLPAGTYYVDATAQSYGPDAPRTKLWLKNETAGTILIVGPSIPTSPVGTLIVRGVFTLATAANISLQHFSTSAQTGNGLGVAAGSGQVEVFSEAFFWKNG